ncbi:MAG: J domain-containing protein [Ruminococcus sp.]|nr:J domain-containing protein [Ruminococcus sp.]
MVYSSIEQICDEFQIDSSLDISTIISELTKKQKDLHPDANPNYSEDDLKMFSRINDAKDFLRQVDKNALVPLSEVISIIKSINNKELTSLEKEEKMQIGIKTKTQEIVKSIKSYYLPRKLTVAGLLALVSFVWAFPSMLTEHPIISEIIRYSVDEFYLFLTMIWLFVLFLSVTLLFFTFRNETYIKNVLQFLENPESQYEIFSSFIKEDCSNSTFTIKDLEEYICSCFSPQKRMFMDKKIRVPRQLLPNVYEISPKIAEMIVFRALEKGVISKVNTKGWYDKYVVESL